MTTVTLTSSSQVLVYHLSSSPLFGQIQQLISQLESVPLLDGELRLLLQECQEELEVQKEDPEGLSILLCYIRRSIIRVLLQKAEGDESIEDQLLAFHSRLIELLRGTLPRGEEVESFLKQYDECQDELEIEKRKNELLLTHFREEIQEIRNRITHLNRTRTELCESLKQRMREIQGLRREDVTRIEGKIDALMKEIDASAEELANQAATSASLAETMIKNRAHLEDQLRKCESMLGKLRV